MTKYHGLDIWAYYIDHEITSAEMVHHIKPIRTDWNDRLSIENLIPLNSLNHSMIEGVYRKGKDQREEMQMQLFNILGKWIADFGV